MSRPLFPQSAETAFYVACEVGETIYVLPVDDVQEIIQPLRLTPLPHGPPAIVGAIEHRERIVPILDLGAQMGFGETTSRRRKWVLVRGAGRTIGVVVDQVHEVFEVPQSNLKPAPDVGNTVARAATHVMSYRGDMAFVLSLSSVAQLADIKLLEGGKS